MKDDIEQKFGLIWPQHVSNLTDLLIAGRQAFDGDLDAFLILAVIGDRTFSIRHADPAQSFESWQRAGLPQCTPLDINAKSIADFTGIPRETVRRKLAALEEKGWIMRDAKGSLQATAKAREDLEPLTRVSIRYLARLFDIFRSVLKG